MVWKVFIKVLSQFSSEKNYGNCFISFSFLSRGTPLE